MSVHLLPPRTYIPVPPPSLLEKLPGFAPNKGRRDSQAKVRHPISHPRYQNILYTLTMSFPAVLGINFGQSYASIAVIGKEGNPSCIANEDGERQIACTVSYNGEEVYIGSAGRQQLVKNGKNTIMGFRNLLGHTYEEVDHTAILAAPLNSAASSDIPSYTVDVLIPAPSPTPAPSSISRAASGANTPIPQREPVPSTKTISVPEITSLFLSTLLQSATDFLGVKPDAGVVISLPSFFTPLQKVALRQAAEAAGMNVLELMDETSAVLVAYRVAMAGGEREARGLMGSPEEGDAGEKEKTDKTVVVVDMGETGLVVGVVAAREGQYVRLGAGRDNKLGGREFDNLLCKHFAKEFTKKTKVALEIPCGPDSSPADKRAEAKLRLAVEHTKRSLSASSGAATCAVESLKEGMDLSAAINRMRFDGLAAGVYRQVGAKVKSVIEECGLDIAQVDEVILAGSSTLLPGLSSHLQMLFPPTVPVTSTIDPSEVIAVGCALEALHLATLPAQLKLEDVVELAPNATTAQVDATSAPIGIVIPDGSDTEIMHTVVPASTPLPARRTVELPLAKGTSRVGLEVWEGKDEIKVEKVEKVANGDVEDDEDESDVEEEDEEVRTAITKKVKVLAGIELDGISAGAKSVVLEIIIDVAGKVSLRLWENGKEEKAVIETLA